MFKIDKTLQGDAGDGMFDMEFWPKHIEELFIQGEFARVIELCEKNLETEPGFLSARIFYTKALWELKRADDATGQLFRILSRDPDNMAALKILGDIQYQKEDFVSAMASYRRVLEIDPECRGLKCAFQVKESKVPQGHKLQLGPATALPVAINPLERLFRTETVGDIYLKQGQIHEALDIFRELAGEKQNERIIEKLANAERLAALKDRRNVEQQN